MILGIDPGTTESGWVHYDNDAGSCTQLQRVQARAEQHGIQGDELKEVMAMLCQPPQESVFTGWAHRRAR
jgi:hypothetical protein